MANKASTILFEAIGNIIFHKSWKMYAAHTATAESFKTFSKFMVLRYLTMSYSPAVRDIVLDNYLLLERMPDKALYRWLIVNVPKQKSPFIQYIK